MSEAPERQIQLPMAKAVKIAAKNIRVRWWRSLLVTSGIILALAFLMYILSSEALARSIAQRGSPELLDQLNKKGLLSALDDADRRVQTWWLVGLALLVSFVGILNAMLMSVTERFREIGTMKCLGALDSLIIKLFLIESTFQGILGTSLGIGIGLLLTYSEGLTVYGPETWGAMPGVTLARVVGLCFLTGTLLTIAGALYPAWRAAKMQPVDAMRSEV
ncbi:MAG: ABC transporter permease [Kiritimatiellae bacterium]|nr:ABC transporter permease [Kiritimatiellia bacterium]